MSKIGCVILWGVGAAVLIEMVAPDMSTWRAFGAFVGLGLMFWAHELEKHGDD